MEKLGHDFEKVISYSIRKIIEFGNLLKTPRKIKVIPTGISSLNSAIGLDGMPMGCLVLISGPAGCGKTSFAYYLAASVQKSGSKVEFIDIKHTFYFDYASQFGVDTNNLVILHTEYAAQLDVEAFGLLIIQPTAGDYKQVSGKVETLIKKKNIDMIIIDGSEGLFPHKGDAIPPSDIKAFSSTLRKWSDLYRHSRTSIVVLCREGDFSERIFKFYADLRIDIRWEPEKDTEIKGLFKIKVIKNKFAELFKEAEIQVSENYLKDSHQEKDMGLEVLCSDCSRDIEKGEMYWVKTGKNGNEEYICELCVSARAARGMEEDIKKYGKVIFSGLD